MVTSFAENIWIYGINGILRTSASKLIRCVNCGQTDIAVVLQAVDDVLGLFRSSDLAAVPHYISSRYFGKTLGLELFNSH